MLTLLSIVVAFILTGVIGNHLIHALQHRNWVAQQRVLGLQKDYDTLRTLFDDISLLAGMRLARMHRLVLSINSSDSDHIERLIKDYGQAVREWNEKLNSLCVRTTIYADYEMTSRLENDIQGGFYEAGRHLDALVAARRSGSVVHFRQRNQVLDALNSIQGVLSNFNRDMLRFVHRQQQRTYEGEVIYFSADRLHDFSTWQLFKALFIPAEQGFSIVRSPSDIS